MTMLHTKRGLSISASFALLALASCSANGKETATVEITNATIEWSACDGEDAPDAPFECATIEVPLDYVEPDLATIEIALVRIPADKEFDYQGILLTTKGQRQIKHQYILSGVLTVTIIRFRFIWTTIYLKELKTIKLMVAIRKNSYGLLNLVNLMAAQLTTLNLI